MKASWAVGVIFFIIIVLISFTLSCLFIKNYSESVKQTYIKTEQGLVRIWGAECTSFGVVLNYEQINILDAEGKPLKCSGEVKLTKEEYQHEIH